MVLVFIFLGFIIINIFLFIILSMCTIKFRIQNLKFKNFKNDNRFKIYIGLYLFNRLKVFQISLDNKKLKKLSENNRLKNINFSKFGKLFPDKKDILDQIHILKPNLERLKLELDLGLDSAPLNAYLVCAMSSLISIIIPLLTKTKNKDEIFYKITPIYCKNVFNIYFESIISIKIVHIINILYILVKKGRDKNERRSTSNRRTYAYSHGFN